MTDSRLICGDARTVLASLDPNSIQTCITSPPYFGLRDYSHQDQIGLGGDLDQYIGDLVSVFSMVHRVLSKDGTLWINIGDSFNTAGRKGRGTRKGYKQNTNRASRELADQNRPTVKDLKPKDLIGVPWTLAFALRSAGWYLRQDIIWAKPNPMPESVTDRCVKSHEYLFLLSKSQRYYFDHRAIQEPGSNRRSGNKTHKLVTEYEQSGQDFHRCKAGLLKLGAREKRNKRSVWTVTPKPFKGAHFATFPPDLIEPCILAGSKPGDVVLDPFFGAGTTGLVAKRLGRKYIGIDINQDYCDMARYRIEGLSMGQKPVSCELK